MSKKKENNSEFIGIIKNQKNVAKEFKHLKIVDNKHFQAEYVKAQAIEILNYLLRLKLTPFKAFESFINTSINRNRQMFLYDFYIKENEFDELVLDEDRINSLILQDELVED